MKKKKSFLIYTESLSVLDELNKEQIADLFLAIKDYQNGVEPKLSGLMKAVFLPFKNYFDENSEKYAKVCEKRRNSGSLGGQANASKSKQMLANASKSKQMRYESDSDSESDSKEKELSNESSKKKTEKRFVIPTVEEVNAYCRERGNGIDAERFVAHYTSNGWKVGKSPMRDWKAAIITWEKGERERSGRGTAKPSVMDQVAEVWDF